MRRRQDEVATTVDKLSFTLGITAPEHIDQMFAAVVEGANSGIGQFFPSFILVRAGTMCLDRQRSVEQQHALFRPVLQIAGRGNRSA